MGSSQTPSDFELLTRSKAIPILLALSYGGRHVRELHEIVRGSASTVQERVSNLLSAGMIKAVEQKGWPFQRMLQLTKKGKRYAALFSNFSILSVPDQLSHVRATSEAKWILATLVAIGGEVKGSTRLQKLLFWLQKNLPAGRAPSYGFSPYKFGPFSSGVLSDAAALASRGLLKIEEEEFEPWSPEGDLVLRRTYKLTDQGRVEASKVLRKIGPLPTSVVSELRRLNSLGLQELLAYVYRAYPRESLVAPGFKVVSE